MIGIVLVSHGRKLAEGLRDLIDQLARGSVRVEVAAGLPDGSLGTDATDIADCIARADDGDGVVVLMDLGSAVLSAETALDLLPAPLRERTALCDAPFVEGAISAAIEASIGSDLHATRRAAQESKDSAKLSG